MKKLHNHFRTFAALAAGIVCLAASAFVSADPPSRVARLGYATGAVSFSPAGEEDWVQATINRPLTTGDRLWADAGARAELQVGGAAIRMDAATSVAVLNLDDSITQLQLTQGTLNVHVRGLDANQVIEVDTPNLAFTVRQPGDYRLMVDADGNATSIYVRKGQGEVYGEGASYVVDARQPYRFTGTGLAQYEPLAVAGLDDFDRWAVDRDRAYDASVSARYVSPDVIGYQDLDANGTWRADPTYGNVWFPNRVEAGWAPYRDGHWAWVDPWGWTWVDDAPWGFAVSHYGRWANMRGSWGWIPGPVRSRAYYAPALVAFVGGNNFSLSISSGNVGGIGWFPLGPREVYRPSYAVSRRYFENVNVSNTVINTTVINNYYNNSNVTNVTYVNRNVPGAIVAVPTTAFVQSQPVNRSAVRVTPQMVANAPVAAVAAVAPTERSVRGAAAERQKPPARVERPVVARATPPAAPAAFAAQQHQLTATPGKPLDDAERKQLRTERAANANAVRVLAAQPKAAAPTPIPPAATAATRPEGRDKGVQRSAPVATTPPSSQVATPGRPARPETAAPAQSQAATPPVRTQAARPPAAVEPPVRAAEGGNAKSDEERAKQAQRQEEAQRVRNAARPPSAPQASAPPPAVPAQQQQREAAQQQQQQRQAQQAQQQQQREAAQQQQQQKAAQQQQATQQREAAQQQQKATQQQQATQQREAAQQQQKAAQQQQQQAAQQREAAQAQQRQAAQQQREAAQAQQQQRAAQQQQQQAAQAQQRAAQQQQQQAAQAQQREAAQAQQRQAAQQQREAAQAQQRAAQQQQAQQQQQRVAQQQAAQQQQQQRQAQQQQQQAQQQQQREAQQQPRAPREKKDDDEGKPKG